MIAMLGMYDMPHLQDANDALWSAIRAQLGHGPDRLTRDRPFWDIWRDPDLLLSQTCALPFRAKLHPDVQLMGTPDYGVDGCPPGYYRSVLVARRDGTDPRDGTPRLAYNEALSQSGWAAPSLYLEEHGIRVAALVETGSHAGSVRAVAEGRADLAGIDAVSWHHLCNCAPEAATLHVLDQTPPTPGLPLITAPGRDAAHLATAIETAISELGPTPRQHLRLNGLTRIDATEYLALPIPKSPETSPLTDQIG